MHVAPRPFSGGERPADHKSKEEETCQIFRWYRNTGPRAISRRPLRPWPGGWRWACRSRPCWGSRARARPSPWPRPLNASSAQPWSWPTIRPWQPSSAPNSGSFSPTTRWSILSPTTTTTSRRPIFPTPTPISRRMPPPTMRSTACASRPPAPCWSGGM